MTTYGMPGRGRVRFSIEIFVFYYVNTIAN
jgi:hypothetical protein